jgi:hypothetical protein
MHASRAGRIASFPDIDIFERIGCTVDLSLSLGFWYGTFGRDSPAGRPLPGFTR